MISWKDDNSNLQNVAIATLNHEEIITPKCCEAPAIHVYGYKHRGNRGSAWAWCSHCGSFIHIDGVELSEHWTNSEKIPLDELTAIPIYLEKHKDIVDEHLQSFMKANSA